MGDAKSRGYDDSQAGAKEKCPKCGAIAKVDKFDSWFCEACDTSELDWLRAESSKFGKEQLFHYCGPKRKIRPYPEFLCSCCPPMDRGEDFNAYKEIKRLYDENKTLWERLAGMSDMTVVELKDEEKDMTNDEQEYYAVCRCGWRGICKFEALCPECGSKTEPDDDYQDEGDS